MTDRNEMLFSGIITARDCPTCGHHEIGLVTEDGVFRPLRTGTRVLVMDQTETAQIAGQGSPPPKASEPLAEPSETLKGRYWVPEPLKGDRRMRLKYGVVIQEQAESVFPLSGHIYEFAYRQKLNNLIEKEVFVPIAVILDRFFAAPHLATGEPWDMINNMWEELEEIRQPVEQVKQWLEKQSEETLEWLVHPGAAKELEHAPINEEAALEELRALTLEDFLALL